MKAKPVDRYDVNMWFLLFLFGVFSCLAIFTAQEMAQYEDNFMVRQAVFFLLAFAITFIVQHIDFEYYLKMSWVLYGFGLFLLVVLFFAPDNIAPTINGAKRWFTLPIIGNFQPSELMKIFNILVLSTIIYNHNRMYQEHTIQSDWKLVGKMAMVVIPPILLLTRQPDMGMIMMTGAIFASLLIVSGITYKILTLLFGIPILGMALFLFAFFRFPGVVETVLFANLSDYQVSRFYGWLNPFEYVDEGFQVARAISLIGTGGLTGNNENIYLPEAHTDFIFAVISHNAGFLGGAMLLILYFVLLYLIIMIAFRCHHTYGTLICVGIVGMLAFQVFQNIGMNVGFLPVTGFTLPFVSYGGSSLVTTMLAVGIALSVRFHTKQFMFSSND